MVRLDAKEISCIKEIFKQYFLENDQLWLFGSRVNLSAKGGDIDLYAESNYTDAARVLDAKLKFLTELEMAIGEQKIDLVIKFNNFNLPIYNIAKKEGVRLV